jgi:hypothetical protein
MIAHTPAKLAFMLLEIQFPGRTVSAHHDNGNALRRALLASIHEELEDSPDESPEEAHELARALGRGDLDDVQPGRPWQWAHGRVQVRVSYDGERPQAL